MEACDQEESDEIQPLCSVTDKDLGNSAVNSVSVNIPIVSKVNRLDVDLYHIDDGDLPEHLRYEAELDVHEKYEWILRDVEALREMVLAEPNLRSRTDKQFLLTFLRARKFDYDKALIMVQKYYKSRHDNKDLYSNLLPSSLTSIWNRNMQTVLSEPDYMDRTILLFFVEAWNPDVVSLEDIFRSEMLILEHIVRIPTIQLRGVCAVVDCRGLTMNHVYCLTPAQIKRMISLIQEVFPLRLKALHFVREPSIFEWAFALIKPFLSETIKGRLHFHGENLTELYEHIPKDILPSELGGTAGPVDNSEIVRLLLKQEHYFKDHFSYGYVEDAVDRAATETPVATSVLHTVAGMGSVLGNYYRRMCIE